MIRSLLAAGLIALAFTAPAAAQELPRRAMLGASAAANPEGSGVTLSDIRAGSPAEAGGLRQGDIVTRIGANDISGPQSFVAAVRGSRSGQRTPFTLTRNGVQQTINVTLGEAPRETAQGLRISYETLRVDGTLRRAIVSEPATRRGRIPAMLLIGGIGCYSMEDANNPYRNLAQDLSRRGVLVMRVDKSGMGDSQGPGCNVVDFNQELAAYDAALTALRADRRVDASRVFVFGHSIGTVGAPELAARHNAAGVIAAQGLGRTWAEYELINTRRQVELGGADAAATDATMIAKAQCMARALLMQEPVAELFAARPECAQLVPLPASQAYMIQLTERNPGADWQAVSAPVLFIYGDADFVTDEADHRRLEAIVNAGHPGNASVAIIPGMDHFLVNRGSQAASFQSVYGGGQAFGEYDPRFSAVIGDWICARARCL